MAFKMKDNLSGKAYEHSRWAYVHPTTGEPMVLSLDRSHRRLAELAGYEAQKLECCINSCMCFAPDAFRNLDRCIYCKEAWRDALGRPRKYFTYVPFAP
jgi:hypothetical protein